MTVRQKSRYCRECGRRTLHAKSYFSGGWGCLLTIVTGGLFIPIWLIAGIIDHAKAWRCQVCGKARFWL